MSDYELSGNRAVPPEVDVVVLPGGRTQVRGPWADCAAAVSLARSSGRLLSATMIEPDGTGRFLVEVRMVPLPEPRITVRPVSWYRAEPGLAVTAGVVVAGLVALAVWAVTTVWPVLPDVGRWLLGIAVGGLVAWFLAGQTGTCPGIHCPGCKCGRA